MKAKHDTRYGHRSGSGSNESKRHERKEQDPDWRSRQGGDQTVTDPPPSDPTGDMSQGKRTRGPDVNANRPHLEGAEQGPR
jgi:hypothetical protein